MTNQFDLTICLVCTDRDKEIRINKWEALLKDKFSKIYLISSQDDEKPHHVRVALVHASDHAFWTEIDIKADYIFQFTSDGNPWKSNLGYQILRETKTDFKIKDTDIQEMIEFIEGIRDLPSMCSRETDISEDFNPLQFFGKEEIRTSQAKRDTKQMILSYLKQDGNQSE